MLAKPRWRRAIASSRLRRSTSSISAGGGAAGGGLDGGGAVGKGGGAETGDGGRNKLPMDALLFLQLNAIDCFGVRAHVTCS